MRGAAAELDFKKVFSEYICKGQKSVTSQQTDEDEEGEDVDSAVTSSIGSSASVTDDRVQRLRLLKQSGQVDEGKRSVIPIDATVVEQWLEGTVARAMALLSVPPPHVFDAGPAKPEAKVLA